jgi:glycosyltransferase involved in cell wall biosynthesis
MVRPTKHKPAKLLVNGYNSTQGGGLRIFQGLVGFLGSLSKTEMPYPPTIIFSLRHDSSLVYEARDLGLKTMVFCPTKFRQLDQIILYFIYLPIRALLNRKSECLLNFGDYIVPFTKRQLYYFDWLYAVIEAGDVWKKMSLSQRAGRWLKRANIRALIKTPNVIIVQSKFVADQMWRTLGRTKMSVIPCPVEPVVPKSSCSISKVMRTSDQLQRLLCLSSFATHKNVEVLLGVARLLKVRAVPVQIVLTLDEADNSVRDFLSRIDSSGLSEFFVNIGVLHFEQVNDWFGRCDALLLPTKLETFGLPYVESLARGRPILTSDLPFAHEICKTGTMFFNPDDPADIAITIENFVRIGGAPIDEALVANILENCRPDSVYSSIVGLPCC